MSNEHSAEFVAFRVYDEFAAPIVPAPKTSDWMNETQGHVATRCLPMLIATQNGWHVRNTSAFFARWDGGSERASVRIAHDRPSAPTLVSSHFGHGILTWTVPYVFRTPPGVELLARGPANQPKDAIAPLEGIVETEWASASFTMNWQFTRPDVTIRFEVGEAYCMLVPQRRDLLESMRPRIRSLSQDRDLDRRYHEFDESRSAFIEQRTRSWQMDYFRGQHVDGAPAESHRLRLDLAPFADETGRVSSDTANVIDTQDRMTSTSLRETNRKGIDDAVS